MEEVRRNFPQGITPQEMLTLQELFLSRVEKDDSGYIPLLCEIRHYLVG